MILNKKADKEILKILLQENKRLKMENQRLNESIDELQRYKDEYKSLISELNQVKECYVKKMGEFDKIGKEYRTELDRLMGDRKAAR